MATVISSISQILFGGASAVFPFQTANLGPLVLDVELLGGTGLPGEVMDLEFFVNGRSVQQLQVRRWSNHFVTIPDRRMIIVPQGFVFYPFPPNNNILVVSPKATVNSKPNDFFFIGPVVFQA